MADWAGAIMTLPEPTFPSTWPPDAHAFCPPPCGGLMSPDNTGTLVCAGCGTAADDAALNVAEVIA